MRARQKELERLRLACRVLREAEKPVRIMRALLWPPEVRERFFAQGERELPRIEYPAFDPRPTLDAAQAVHGMARGAGTLDAWLRRLADAIAGGARMLAGLGTPAFHQESLRLFGAPTHALPDEKTTSLALALRFNEILDGLSSFQWTPPADEELSAEEVAEMMREAVRDLFGERAPRVRLVRHLGSKALAGSQRIRVRKGARFTRKEAEQLIQHEAFIHIVTSINGRSQEDLVILGAGHPGTTRTQEGLAVFAEFITGSMDLHRLRRLADRVFAIQQAIEGADFLDIYRYFLDRTGERERAFEGAWRVFRGAPLTGGYPLTKDIVYLDGLLRVHSFLRSVVSSGRPDVVALLFCGKLALNDLPALCHLADMGLLRRPEFVPPWAADPGHLLSYLTFSSFLNTVNLQDISSTFLDMLAEAPVVRFGLENGAPSALAG